MVVGLRASATVISRHVDCFQEVNPQGPASTHDLCSFRLDLVSKNQFKDLSKVLSPCRIWLKQSHRVCGSMI